MDLIHLAIIWAGVLFTSWLADKTKLTPTLYFLALGAVFVNFGILPAQTSPFLEVFSEIGIILIMFALGFEESSNNFIASIKRSWGIAFFGAVAPFFTAYALTLYFWNDSNIALVCGLAMTATAVSLTMVSLRAEGLHRSAAATGIMTSAVLDDVAALALVAVLIPVVTGSEPLSTGSILLVVGKACAFFALVTLLGTVLFPQRKQLYGVRIPFILAIGIRNLLATQNGANSTLIILLAALLVALLGHFFGFHPAIGAYMAGLILREEYFQFDEAASGSTYEMTRRIIDNVAFSWIGPVFFVVLGTKLVFEADLFLSLIPETIVLTVCLILAQVSSAALSARYTGKFHWHESLMIGLGMLGRAELAFVVMEIAYVDHAILSKDAFYTLMFTAFWLNLSVPLSIRLFRPKYDAQEALLTTR